MHIVRKRVKVRLKHKSLKNFREMIYVRALNPAVWFDVFTLMFDRENFESVPNSPVNQAKVHVLLVEDMHLIMIESHAIGLCAMTHLICNG